MSGRFGRMALDSAAGDLSREMKRAEGDADKFNRVMDKVRALPDQELRATLASYLGYLPRGISKEQALERVKDAWRNREGKAYDAGKPGKPLSSGSDKVERYNRELEKALGTPNFHRVFEQMKSDKDMKREQVHALAKKFAGAAGRSKDHSLHKIQHRQTNLEILEAKRIATAGRTAA